MIGSVIQERYLVESELGRGGMGVVYRAEDTLLERPVAVKIVSASGLGTEGQSRLLQEARAAARLNHPHIVAVYDVGTGEMPNQEGAFSYIVMELVEGQTLREYQPQNLGQIIDLARAICDALEIAHQQGIIHRDLKPENVSVTQSGMIKLMDFGLARISGKTRMTEQGTFMGTYAYLAPEIILGQEADARSDLYALGVMLYEMSAGRPPFEAENITAVISQHLYAPVVPPSAYNDQVPPALDLLIVRMLSKQPGDRPQTATAVRLSLEEIGHIEAGSKPESAIPQLNRLVRGRMVGRQAEFAQAVALWEKAAGTDGQLLLISGEPGIGKTRLIKELNAWVEISGGKTLLGLCFAEERTPYGAIAQMVQTSLENGSNLELPKAVLADLVTLAPELRLIYPDLLPNERLDPDAEQQRLFESIVTWFGALTKDDKLLLIIDDVHWADSGSLALLRYLARRLNRRRALIVATYREVELDVTLPFRETLQEINRERLATRIKLSGLDVNGTGELLATLFAEEIQPEFLEGIYRETEGNPFFIEEVCKALVDNGKLYYEKGHWHRPDDIAELEIPQGIRSTIQTRLSKLSEEEQDVLQKAALLGREFEYEMLVAISDLDEDGLIDALERAESAQLIEELHRSATVTSPTFNFTHALIHSTLLSNLSTLRRQRLQKQVAMALEESFPDRQRELAPLLGRYFAEAGDGEKGVHYLLLAGDDAREVFAYEEAIEAYEHAQLFLIELGDHELAARTLMKLGLTYHNIFAFDAARKAYERGFDQWQRAKEADVLENIAKIPAPHPLRVTAGIPPALDPAKVNEGYSGWCIGQLFSGLLQFSAEDELLPDVADSWEVLDGGLRYIFHLRDDVRWSDGKPVTAHDFEFSWKRTLHPDNKEGLFEILFDIQGARAYHNGQLPDADSVGVSTIDENTLLVTLEGPSSYFLQLLAIFVAMPVPRHVVNERGPDWSAPENIVTNGPFLLNSVTDELMIFQRNVKYHGRFKGNLNEVHFTIAVGEVGLDLYDQDQLDILYPYGHTILQEARRIIQRHPDEYISMPEPITRYLAFDTTRAPFDDPRVRLAMVFAIDRVYMANRQAQGLIFPAGGGMVPPGVAGHVQGLALPYSPETARKKLAEAGFPGGEGIPPLNGTCFGFGAAKELTDYLVAQWKTILGIDSTFDLLDFTVTDDHYEKNPPHMWLRGWSADYLDPDSFLRYGKWRPQSGWHNEKYQALVENARRTADQQERMVMYQQAEQMIKEEAPIIPLYYGRNHLLIKPWLHGLPASMITGNILKDIIIEPH